MTSPGDWRSVLATHPNVVGTHHIGASTLQAQRAVAGGAARVIKKYTKGRVINCVNLVEEPRGACMVTIRHRDHVGVLARIFDQLRLSGINVQQMQNQVFSNEGAAVASINLADTPPTRVLRSFEADPDVLGVAVHRNGRKPTSHSV